MTEPTPDPDDPGEGLRTRSAPGQGALITVTLDMSMPMNSAPDSHDSNSHNSNGHKTNNGHTMRIGHTNHGSETRNGRLLGPHANGAHNDNMNVDAASPDTVLSNGAPGDPRLANATGPRREQHLAIAGGPFGDRASSDLTVDAPRATANGNGSHGPDGTGPWSGEDGIADSVKSGVSFSGPNGAGEDKSLRNGYSTANGHADGRRAGNGHAAGDLVDPGPASNGHTAGGLVGPGATGNGRTAGGLAGSGPAAGNGSRVSVTFGFGETAGVLPGDQRTFDDVEAGIVSLWRQFGQRREQPLRDRLVLHYAPLVKYVAGRVGTGLPAHVEVADLIQSGIFGLVDAIEKFEPARGLKFETYAMQRIRGAILDDLRAQDWVPRSVRGRAREVERALERLGAQLRRTPTDAELADELGLSLQELRDVYAQLQLTSVVALDELAAAGRGPTPLADILEDQEALDPVALLVDQDNRRQLAQAIAHLAERDRVVVTLYYFENLTLAEIGRVLGVTESRVCQLHTRAVLRLRAKLLEKTDA
jgi:RNA polymerase sigma factor FliA